MCYAVNEAFIQLHRTGKIFRKESLINWSCQLQSAISEIEVEHREIEGPTLVQVPGYDKTVPFGQLYQFGYKLSDDKDGALILVSTTRPETIAGDTAIAVHPEDDRYAKYIGKFARHPIRHEDIPIIADPAVDKFFGTGTNTDFLIVKTHLPLSFHRLFQEHSKLLRATISVILT